MVCTTFMVCQALTEELLLDQSCQSISFYTMLLLIKWPVLLAWATSEPFQGCWAYLRCHWFIKVDSNWHQFILTKRGCVRITINNFILAIKNITFASHKVVDYGSRIFFMKLIKMMELLLSHTLSLTLLTKPSRFMKDFLNLYPLRCLKKYID